MIQYILLVLLSCSAVDNRGAVTSDSMCVTCLNCSLVVECKEIEGLGVENLFQPAARTPHLPEYDNRRYRSLFFFSKEELESHLKTYKVPNKSLVVDLKAGKIQEVTQEQRQYEYKLSWEESYGSTCKGWKFEAGKGWICTEGFRYGSTQENVPSIDIPPRGPGRQ